LEKRAVGDRLFALKRVNGLKALQTGRENMGEIRVHYPIISWGKSIVLPDIIGGMQMSEKYIAVDALLKAKHDNPDTEYKQGWNDALDAVSNIEAQEMDMPEITDVMMPGVHVINIDYVENLFMDGGDMYD